MFDIGFPELLIVSIVALLVLGPERLPETIRTVGLWVGRIKRMFSDVKADIEREIGADEIRQQIHNENILKELKQAENSIKGITQQPVESLAKNSLDKLVQDQNNSTSDGHLSSSHTQSRASSSVAPLSTASTPDHPSTQVKPTDSNHENESVKSN